MITIWRFDIVFGLTKGYWFQCWKYTFFDSYKIIDIGFRPFLFAIYYRAD